MNCNALNGQFSELCYGSGSRSSSRWTSACDNLSSRYDVNLPAAWYLIVWSPQTVRSAEIAFRQWPTHSWFLVQSLSDIQTNNFWSEHLAGFSGGWIWIWYLRWAMLSSFHEEKIKNKSRISGNLAARLLSGKPIGLTSEGEVWMD
jgi:hypothetical protein